MMGIERSHQALRLLRQRCVRQTSRFRSYILRRCPCDNCRLRRSNFIGKIFGKYRLDLCNGHGVLHDVGQLPYIAGPGILHQQAHGLRRNAPDQAALRRDALASAFRAALGLPHIDTLKKSRHSN